MDWVKERDALIAQTVAFVQSVTGRKPDFATAPNRVMATKNSAPSDSSAVVDRAFASKPAEPLDQSRALLPDLAFPQSDVRQEVQNRIAAFQAHQHRFQRDRDVYFKSVLARARADIETRTDLPPLGSATAGDSPGV